MNRSVVFLVACSGLALGACASVPASKARFPSAAAVAEFARQPVVAPADAVPIADVAEWKLTGPLPDLVNGSLHRANSAWDRLLREVTTGDDPGLFASTEAAACAAREIGLFRAVQPGAPSQRLVRFIAARCGLTAPTIVTDCRVDSAGGEGTSDDQVFAAQGAAVKAAIAGAVTRLGADALEAGLWAGRKETHPLICWVVAPRLFAVKRATLTPNGWGAITIEGDMMLASAPAGGLVTAGRLGTQACVVVSSQPPSLSLSCPVSGGDFAAWIEVEATNPDEIGSRTVLSLLVWPAGKPDDTYRRLAASGGAAQAHCPSSPLSDQAVVACINHAREAVHAKPLALAGDESRTVAALVPRLFAGLQGRGPAADAEQVSLGLRAGWQANADLSFGALAEASQEGTPDPAVLVSALLEHPRNRAALLDPQASLLAVGAAPLGSGSGGSTGLVAAVYRVIPDQPMDQHPFVQQVLARIAAIRAARGQEPIKWFDVDGGRTMHEASHVTSGRNSPLQAISTAARGCSESLKVAHVHGWTLEIDDPSLLVVPELLLSMSEVAVGVGRYRRPGEPWARLVVLLVAPHEGRDKPGDDVGLVSSSNIYNSLGT